jgi:hypothetical protein
LASFFPNQAFIRLLLLFRYDLGTDFTQRQVGSVRQQPEQVRFPLKGQYRQMILTAQDGDLGFRIFDYCGLTIRGILRICRDSKIFQQLLATILILKHRKNEVCLRFLY